MIPNKQIHVHALFCHGTGASTRSEDIKLALWTQISFLVERCGHESVFYMRLAYQPSYIARRIKVITKLPNSEQSYKGKVQTHNYINRQNQSTTGKL